MIEPVVTYASGVWSLAKSEQRTLELRESKILRKFFGSGIVDNECLKKKKWKIKRII